MTKVLCGGALALDSGLHICSGATEDANNADGTAIADSSSSVSSSDEADSSS